MSTSADPTTPGIVAAAVSYATVRTLSEYTGRGPTKARTYISDDLISVVLRDTPRRASARSFATANSAWC